MMSELKVSTLKNCSQIDQFGTQNKYFLKSINLIEANQLRYSEIYQSCSKDPIYKWLFTKRFPEGYSLNNAKEFFLWAQASWKQGAHFVYLITDQKGSIVGSIDIRSNNLPLAETGYWVSPNHSGLASNALAKLIEIAKEAGYKALFAQVEARNVRSIKVLERNGFSRDDSLKTNENCDQAYKKLL